MFGMDGPDGFSEIHAEDVKDELVQCAQDTRKAIDRREVVTRFANEDFDENPNTVDAALKFMAATSEADADFQTATVKAMGKVIVPLLEKADAPDEIQAMARERFGMPPRIETPDLAEGESFVHPPDVSGESTIAGIDVDFVREPERPIDGTASDDDDDGGDS